MLKTCQKLQRQKLGSFSRSPNVESEEYTEAPMFWTNKNKNILTAISFADRDAGTIYEFDASTLETVGTPFKGHTNIVTGLALSFNHDLLASAAEDDTIKLWAFQSRQLLASFDIQEPYILVFSPDSRQLTYATYSCEICICDTPSDVLAQARSSNVKLALSYLLAPVSSIVTPPPPLQIPSSTVGSLLPQLRGDPHKLLPSSSHTPTVSSARNVEPDDLPLEEMLQDLSKCITKDGDYPVTRGGFGEIWKCTLHINRSSVKVAVKALQVYADDQLGAPKMKKIKRIKRELKICAKLNHANILRIHGYTYGFGPFPAIISPWAENGNLTVYLEREGAALTLVRRFQLAIHANSVIHGDFNGASWTSTLKGNMRWMAPELLLEREDGSQVRPSEQSDMYSFGGVMLQVLTNKVPYYHLTNDARIIFCIAKSETPSRSRYSALPEKYWEFIEQCWSTDPWDRPSTERADTTIRNEFYSLSRSR
ncbi:kinase-like domain-containing protein [Suillus variegatus]|nr:kinase-like domain-containing protein [Suillus variegatus]